MNSDYEYDKRRDFEIDEEFEKEADKKDLLKTINSEQNDLIIEKLLVDYKGFKDTKVRLISIMRKQIHEYELKISRQKEALVKRESLIKEQISDLLDRSKMSDNDNTLSYILPNGEIVIFKETGDFTINFESDI